MPDARERPEVRDGVLPSIPLVEDTHRAPSLPERAGSVPSPGRLVSDDERERAVDRLRTASSEGRLTLDEFSDRVSDAYRSRTDLELERVVADLPVPAPQVSARPPVRWTVGVLGSQKRRGPWRPDHPTRAVAVLGSCQLDLCAADLPGDLEIRGAAVLGGIEVLVPEGVAVEFGGFSVLGSRDDRVRRSSLGADAPVVTVRVNVVLGGVTVRTRRSPVP